MPMPTNDELLRTESPITDFEVRFFAGPKREMIRREDIAMGEYFKPFVSSMIANVDGVTPESETIHVLNTAEFTSGAILIHPGGEDEDYEMVQYSGKTQQQFTGLTRVVPDNTGKNSLWGWHSQLSVVSEFFEVTGLVTRAEINFNEEQGAAFWSVTLEGRNYNSYWLDNDNTLCCQIRQRPKNGNLGEWTDWRLWWLGYVKSANIKDSSSREREWEATIEGISQYVSGTETPPKHYGKNDLAEEKTITVSSYLEDPYQEWGTGEFDGFPDLDGNQVNDGDLGTLWISEGEPDATPEVPIFVPMTINEVFLRPREGFVDRDHQWIEIFSGRAEERLSWYSLVNRQTTWQRTSSNNWWPENNYVELKGGRLNMDEDNGGFVILTFNLPRFMEQYPYHSADRVIDIRPWIVGEFELNIEEGDFLGLMNWHVNCYSVVWWTAGGQTWESQAPYPFSKTQTPPGETGFWTGPMIPIPPRNHSIRRYPCGNTPSYYTYADSAASFIQDERHPTPGYHITGDPEWIAVDLGNMNITLEDPLADGQMDEAKLSKSPLGLRKSGWVRINQEIIGYDNRNDNDNTLEGLTRGVQGTTPAYHPAESLVEALDSLDSEASNNYLVSSTSWRRRAVAIPGTGVMNVPMMFDVYVTPFVDPIMPDDEDWEEEAGGGGWEDYWERIIRVRKNVDTFWIGAFEPRRVRHMLVMFHEMTGGGRLKLNQWHVWSDQVDLIEVPPDADEEIHEVVDGAYSGAMIFDLVTRVIGLDPELFTLQDKGRPFIEMNTSTSTVMEIIRDICRRTGTSTVFEMDEEVIHRFHPLYPGADLEDIAIEWTRLNAQSVSLSRPFRHNVKQVVIRALEKEEEETFEAKFPGEPLDFGSTVKLEDWVLTDPNDAALMAEFMFRQRNAPLSATVVPVGPAEWVRPGQRHVITWGMDAFNEYLNRRNFVVTGVRWGLRFGDGKPGDKTWQTSVKLKELIF